MDNHISTLISSLLSVYLPISDIGSRVAISLAFAALITGLIRKIYDFVLERELFKIFFFCGNNIEVEINSENPIYENIMNIIRNDNTDKISKCKYTSDFGKKNFIPTKFFNNKIIKTFMSDSQTHQIEIYFREKKNIDPKNSGKNYQIQDSDSLILRSKSIGIVEKYLDEIIRVDGIKIANKIPIYRVDITSKKSDNRDIRWKCVVTKLSKNIKNTIVSDNIDRFFYEDISEFMKKENYYLTKGIPYKRGYLLYGNPGCGKTSLIKAVANQYNLPIFIVDLSILKSNSELVKIMSDISSHLNDDQKYMVVFEDVDRSKVFDRYSYNCDITKDCLLNVLDGVEEHNGRITIMTTNSLDKVLCVEALVRPGRIDSVIEIGDCTTAQIEKIMRFHLDAKDDVEFKLNGNVEISPAQLTRLIQTVKDFEKVLNILNNNKNIKNISAEKFNSVCDDFVKKIEKNEEMRNEEKKEDVEEIPRNIKFLRRRIHKCNVNIEKIDIYIKEMSDSYSDLSDGDKIKYEKQVLLKKELEIKKKQLETSEKVELYDFSIRKQEENEFIKKYSRRAI